eukprot:2185073-Prymnesium_polylepis.1
MKYGGFTRTPPPAAGSRCHTPKQPTCLDCTLVRRRMLPQALSTPVCSVHSSDAKELILLCRVLQLLFVPSLVLRVRVAEQQLAISHLLVRVFFDLPLNLHSPPVLHGFHLGALPHTEPVAPLAVAHDPQALAQVGCVQRRELRPLHQALGRVTPGDELAGRDDVLRLLVALDLRQLRRVALNLLVEVKAKEVATLVRHAPLLAWRRGASSATEATDALSEARPVTLDGASGGELTRAGGSACGRQGSDGVDAHQSPQQQLLVRLIPQRLIRVLAGDAALARPIDKVADASLREFDATRAQRRCPLSPLDREGSARARRPTEVRAILRIVRPYPLPASDPRKHPPPGHGRGGELGAAAFLEREHQLACLFVLQRRQRARCLEQVDQLVLQPGPRHGVACIVAAIHLGQRLGFGRRTD